MISKSKFLQLIRLTFSVEVAQAFQVETQAWAQASSQAQAQAFQAASQAWAQASSQVEAQAWAQAFQAQAQAFQAEAQAWVQAFQAQAQAFQAQGNQPWAQANQDIVQASQTWAQAFQAASQAWAQASSQVEAQAWAQAFQAEAQAFQAQAQAFQAQANWVQTQTRALSTTQAFQAQTQAQAQAFQAEVQANQAWAASQAWAQASSQVEAQAWAQAFQAEAEALRAQAQAFQAQAASQSQSTVRAQAWAASQTSSQTRAQRLKINLTLEKIEIFFTEDNENDNNQELAEQLEQIQKQKKKLKKENTQFKTKVKQLLELKESDELPANWNELLIKKTDKIQKGQELQEELNSKEEKFNKLESEIKELRKKEDELEDEISDLKKQIRKANNDQEKKTLEEKLEDINKELERTQDKLKTSEEARGKLRNEMNTLRDNLKELQSTKGNELDRLSYENNKLTLDLNAAKEKIRKLENSDMNSEQIKNLKENLDSLTKQLEEAKSELAFLKITNSPSESKDKETSEMTSELSDASTKLETTKGERVRLGGEISSKEKQRKNLENEGKAGSDEYRRLLVELEELRKKLTSVEQEIERLRRQVANLKEQLNASYQALQEEIEEVKETLEKAKEKCLEKLEEKQSFFTELKDAIKNSDHEEKLNRLLQSQKEIIKYDSVIATREKDKIIESVPKKFSEDLKSLCVLQEQLTQLEMKKKDIEKAGHVLKMVMIAPVMPPQLRDIKNDLSDICDIKKNINYEDIKSSREFSLSKNYKAEKLPTRLCNIQKNKLEETNNSLNIDKYAILSYVWGEKGELSANNKRKVDEVWENIGYKNELNPSGYKSLVKAIETCKSLNINYLWMDQLCTNQGNNEDKNREVPKMRQYYFNSAVTLVAIHSSLSEEIEGEIDSEKILEKVVRSQWFSRSWTFQEGWLSKQTIFMFDNVLVDGSLLANRWVLGQPAYTENARYKDILHADSQKIATPLGWVYYKEGYSEEDRISFSLNQALRAIKKRERGASIDGIYSILGLLPYGEQVKPKYKNWGEEYSEKELQEALMEVVKVATDNGYGELFSWHGSGNNWLPEIYKEGRGGHLERTKGGTSIEGGLTVIQKEIDSVSRNKISVFEYVIKDILKETIRKEINDKGSAIDSGACVRNFLVSTNDDNQKEMDIALLSTNRILESQVQKGNILLLLSKKEWRSNKPFALIVRKELDVYKRIGLVEIKEEDQEKLLQLGKEEKLSIKFDKEQYQFQIEITPK